MSNKRKLKRTINYICSDLFAEALATSLYGDINNKESIEQVLSSILIIHNNYISRVSHVEPGMPPTKYFSDLITSFNKEVIETIDQINNIS